MLIGYSVIVVLSLKINSLLLMVIFRFKYQRHNKVKVPIRLFLPLK